MKRILLIIALSTFTACKPVAEKVVEAMTESILEPVSVKLSHQEDFGEMAVSDHPITITMEIKNNSSTEIRKLKLDIAERQNVMAFAEDQDGLSASPGYTGTCSNILSPGQKCTYKISMVPRKIGKYAIGVKFFYENLIEPQEKSYLFTATVGEPASLVFTNDVSNYDLGVIEQTNPTRNLLELEVQNIGGLSARKVDFTLINDIADGAYEVIENSCPSTIVGGSKCKVKIGYTPHNNNYNDPAVLYTGKYSFDYLKDPNDNTGKLNAYFSLLSVAIEANFKQNFSTVEFSKLVTGNQESKSVKISNGGHRAGIMQEMKFHDYQGNLITTCQKSSSGNLLNCQKNLTSFPFIVEDTNNCFEREVSGIVGKTPGESCFFKITYWPSTGYLAGTQSINYFNDATISLTYDSQWKGAKNIVTKNSMFTIIADYLAAGKLVLDKLEIENVPILSTDIIAVENVIEADLGRIALVSSSDYTSFIKLTYRNIGENPVIFNSIKDGAATPNEIIDVGYDLNGFYKQIKHNSCTVVAPGATCNVSFNLAPVVQASSAIEDTLMYDNYSNPLKKYKQLFTSYKDGSTIEDNGAPATDRMLEVRMVAKLVRKGYLTIELTPATTNFTFPTIANGSSNTKNIFLKNVGTGDVYAVLKDQSKNFDPKSAQHHFPYKVMDLGTPILPATKDCFDILYAAGSVPSNMPVVPDISKFLAPGESCVLGIENKLPEISRSLESDYAPATDYTRPFSSALNNTAEIWNRKNYNQAAIPISFQYYDGDTNPSVPSSYPYGYLGSTKEINVASAFSVPANIVVKDPEPITSALFARPPLYYPSITSTYPTNYILSAKTILETYFDSSYFTNAIHGFAKSKDAVNHVKAMNLVGGVYDGEYKFHAGTFPTNQTTSFQFKFFNAGQKSATTATLSEEAKAADYPIQVTSLGGATIKPYPTFNMAASSSLSIQFSFNPTAPGLYKRCYTLTYGSSIDTREQYVCVYAEAVASAPKMKIEYKDVLVTQTSSTTVSESEPGVFVTLNTPMNSTDTTSLASFNAIKGSIVYAKKRFKITNTGTAPATKFSFFNMDTPTNAGASVPPEITAVTTGLSRPCSSNMTIAAGDYCEIYIKYSPITSTAATLKRYLGTIFDIGAGLNQYISHTAYMEFFAFDPAKLAVNITGVNQETIRDWSNPAAPVPVNASWPINLGNYSTASGSTHMRLTTSPTTKSVLNIQIKNSSALKASFLSMNPAPGAGTWNSIYSNADITIWANRYCFYGDDENNGAIPADEKGFNSTSINKCLLQIDFSGFKPYESCSAWNAGVKTKVMTFGQNIVANCNPYAYTLKYWNYKRAAQDNLYIHMKGFIEPNRVVASPASLSNVNAYSTSATAGSVSFSWPELNPVNSGWGTVVKYRVYYDTNYNNLNGVNVFKLTSTIAYKETMDATVTSITIPNLLAGKYYYFKVFAVQKYTDVVPNLTYLSNSNIPIATVPIPTPTQVYNHSLQILADKAYKPTPGIRSAAVSACTSDYYNLNIGGTVRKAYKKLINSSIFNYLQTSATYSSGYPAEGIGAIPHWLLDNAYDLKSQLSLYDGSSLAGFPGYNPLALSGNSPDYEVLYQKTCTNNSSCDLLYKIVGGDGMDLYFAGTFYTTATGTSAYARCYGVILCPTNVAKAITDPTCAKP